MLIDYPHDSQKHRTVFGRRGPVFEVNLWKWDAPLSWWISWLITMKGIELVHLYSNNGREEFRSMYDAFMRIMSNYFKEFTDNLLLNVESCNKYIYSCCIIFVEDEVQKKTTVMT